MTPSQSRRMAIMLAILFAILLGIIDPALAHPHEPQQLGWPDAAILIGWAFAGVLGLWVINR